jgi:acyl-coenzyme A synthetase/AMP-(fatty) acid ligase
MIRIDGVRSVGAVRRGPGSAFPLVFAATDLPRRQLCRALVAELDAHRAPKHPVLLHDLPVNENGKVDRARLRALAEELSGDDRDAMEKSAPRQ